MSFLIAFLLGLLASLAGAFWLAGRMRRTARSHWRRRARLLRRDAEADAKKVAEDAALEARRERLRMQREAEAEFEELQAEIAREEVRIAALEERLQVLLQEVEAQEAKFRDRNEQAERTKQANRAKRKEAQALARKADRLLEERAGVRREEVVGRISDAFVAQVKASWQDRLRNLEAELSPEIEKLAKRVVGITIGRYLERPSLGRPAGTVPLSDEDLAWFAAPEGHRLLSALEELTGVALSLDEPSKLIRLDSPDGLAKELARRAVEKVLSRPRQSRGRLQPKVLVDSLRRSLDQEIRRLGKEAFKTLGLQPAKPEVVQLVGRLAFRSSYSQNQYSHALEAAFLAGLMAQEIGLDPDLAKRAALLHDIGKALTHEIEGSHAAIGAEIAERNGEPPEVVDAIRRHHEDGISDSIYTALVAAADAISGARPGARRELAENYVDRMADLERVARSFSGVTQVHAMQAGREVRVLVDERALDDEASARLAAEIARKIADEVVVPGQVKVTVIRRLSVEEVAR